MQATIDDAMSGALAHCDFAMSFKDDLVSLPASPTGELQEKCGGR
ncbi:hypothetical protein DFP91_3151 [Pseudorhodoplanes sinuspersici]|nr:hypothetical protein DFP91_3151 [Pseudorhodoplanes sinuspersici]